MAFVNEKISDFLNVLASDSPAPGGGTVAALGAALGSALVSMVANLTIGKEKYKENWQKMEDVLARAEKLRADFSSLMDEDTESFNSYMAAFRLPKETDAEKTARSAAILEAAKKATETPLRTLECCVELAEIANVAVRYGNPNTASDGGSAGFLAQACGNAASFNVRINLPGVKDEKFVSETTAKMMKYLDDIARCTRETSDALKKTLD